jgi:hypothetical protein
VVTRIDEMLKKFAMLMSAEQKELQERVKMKGGVSECVKDNKKLRALLEADSGSRSYISVAGTDKAQAGNDKELEDFKRELRETPMAAMENNWAKFEGKLKITEKNILCETEKIVERSSNRTIDELKIEFNKGPQNNILDRVSWLRLRLRLRRT